MLVSAAAKAASQKWIRYLPTADNSIIGSAHDTRGAVVEERSIIEVREADGKEEVF